MFLASILKLLKSAELQNILQLDIHAQINHRMVESLQEMMGHLPLPSAVSVGLVYIMDATGRCHELTMNMARSFEVRLLVRYFYRPY